MNTCAACHAGTYAGKFRLERVYADGPNARPGTQRNLAAALALIDRAKPAASALLQQATAAHGGAPGADGGPSASHPRRGPAARRGHLHAAHVHQASAGNLKGAIR